MIGPPFQNELIHTLSWLQKIRGLASPLAPATRGPESLGIPRLRDQELQAIEEPGMEILQHGEARFWNEPVLGRLRRPHGICAKPGALPSLDRARARPDRQYGRRMYEAMRYWDEERPEWSAEQHEFAAAWRRQPKWVVSRSLKSVGPNATLVEGDIEAVIRDLKARLVGEIAVSGPDLARSLTDLGLIDEYRLYFHPVVLGRGKPFFAGPRPPLRLVASDLIGADAIRLTYVPA